MNGLRALRQRRMLTQVELAEKLDVRYQTVGTWEMGTARPRPAMLRKLCEVLSVSPDELFDALNTPAAEAQGSKIAA